MNDIDLNKRLLEACGAGISDVSDGTSESHSYKKEFSTQTGSVVVDASAQSVDELKLLLQKVGITLPGGEPAGHDHEGPSTAVVVHPDYEDHEPVDEPTDPYNSGTPAVADKQVLTNILRDKLKAYLMNGSK
tara:strand:- start:5931 stop:6326 length:396 start_codon:yes stop_codon:yes gene_type:complete